MNSLKINDKKQVYIILIFMALVLMILISLFTFKDSVKKDKLDNITFKETDNVIFAIENINIKNDGYYVEGYFLDQGNTYTFYNYGMDKDITGYYNNYSISLINDDMVYSFPTKMVYREDINECYYGFETFIPEKYIKDVKEKGLDVVFVDPYNESYIYDVNGNIE